MASRRYTFPPVQEVVAEVRLASQMSAAVQAKVRGTLAADLPNSRAEVTYNVHVDPVSGKSTLRVTDNGFRLSSPDGLETTVVQHGTMYTVGFGPYPGWKVTKGRLKRLVSAWLDAGGEFPASQVGLKYTNRVDIPIDLGREPDPFEYVNYGPRAVPVEGTMTVASSEMRFDHPSGFAVILAGGLAEPHLIGVKSWIVVVDVLRQNPGLTDLDGCLKMFEDMHALGQETFESLVTDKARKLWK